MIRKIIHINEGKCNGCGLCTEACHEGAIGMMNGKARLLRDDYCDGLGDCLPICPTGAITFEEREAAEYDEAAVKARMTKMSKTLSVSGCPGSKQQAIDQLPNGKASPTGGCSGSNAHAIRREQETVVTDAKVPMEMSSQLNQWPVQIKLAPVNAPYFAHAHLLIAADCTAFACGDFHSRFMKGKITLIGCPKLDDGDYSEKLTTILKEKNIRSVTVVRMEVPCCGGIANAATHALQNCGKMIPWQIVTISTDGRIIDE